MSTTLPPGSASSSPAPVSTGSRDGSTLRYLASLASVEGVHPAGIGAVPSGPALVRDVMITGVVAAHEGAVFKEIVDAITRNHISAVPVIDAQRRVIGVVSESDLLARVSGGHLAHPRGHLLSGHREERAKLHAATAYELMTSPAIVTTPSTSIAEAARVAGDSRVRRLPVVDANGILVGIVTRANLLQPFLRPDADIRSDIEQNVVIGAFVLNTQDIEVRVKDGVVTLRGQLDGRLMVEELVELVQGVGGVIDVEDSALTYRVDDSRIPPPLVRPY